MTEFSVEQVRAMRAEVSDNEFCRFIEKNPGHTWHLDRRLNVHGNFTFKDTCFVYPKDGSTIDFKQVRWRTD